MKLFEISNIPISIIIGFNLFTLLVFYTAPYDWATDNISLFFLYALVSQFFIFIGYQKGFKKSKLLRGRPSFLLTIDDRTVNKIFIFYLLTFLIRYAYRLRFNIFDVKGMFNFLLIGIADPQLGYSLSLDEVRPLTVSWSLYFLVSILDNLFFIIGFIKWGDFTLTKKVIFIGFLAVEIFYWMGRGTNFGIITLITTLALSLLYKLRGVDFNFKRIFGFLIGVIFMFSISIISFSYTMQNRAGNKEIDIHYFDFITSEVDKDNIVFEIIPDNFHQSYLYIVNYICQGYYHTALAFDLDFKFTLLFGNNPSLIDISRLLDLEIWEDTYVYRLKDLGVDPLLKWHSAYLWYASDFSFFGVPIILGFIGYFLGISWGYILSKNDLLSKIIFIILGNMLIYLFANNSYLSSILYSLICVFPIWYFTRCKKIIYK